MRLFQFLSRRERGQVLMIAAVLFPVLLGMAGMAVDVGSYASERRNLQNAADSIALAAAQELPDESAATAAGQQWATRNNVPLSELDLQFSGSASTTPKVRAVITTQHEFAFMRRFRSQLPRGRGEGRGRQGVIRWKRRHRALDHHRGHAARSCRRRRSCHEVRRRRRQPRQLRAIRIDGPGANTYGDSVKFGSSTFACAITAPNCTVGACPARIPPHAPRTAPECDGPECTPRRATSSVRRATASTFA